MTVDRSGISDIPEMFRKFKGTTKDGLYDLYCQEFAYSIIYGNLNGDNLEQILELVGLKELPDRLLLAQVDHLDIYQFYPEFSSLPRMQNVVQSLQRGLKRLGEAGMVASYPGRGVVGIFLCLGNQAASENRELIARAKQAAAELIRQVHEETEENISIGISRHCSSLFRFPQAYAECKEGLFHCFRLGRNQSVYFRDIKEPETPFDRQELRRLLEPLLEGIADRDQEKTSQVIHRMADYALSVALSPVDIRMVFISVVDTVRSHMFQKAPKLNPVYVERLYLKTARRITNSMYAEDILEAMEDFGRKMMTLLGEEPQSEEEAFLRQVDDTIGKYYSNGDFSLDIMAEIFHYSPYHFGRMFKSLRGESFRQYLTVYRIERAKELLAKGGRLNDVAFQTGFNSSSYFCTVFKHVTGISPKQYQERFL